MIREGSQPDAGLPSQSCIDRQGDDTIPTSAIAANKANSKFRPEINLPSRMVRIALAFAIAFGCQVEAKTIVTKKPFGKTEDGIAVDLYTLKNEKLEATITTFGARVVTLMVPDRTGKI